MAWLSAYINNFLDHIDNWLNYIGVKLLKLPTFQIFNFIFTPKTQTTIVFIVWFLMWTIRVSNAFAHQWHGDEEAANLWSTASLSGDAFINPMQVNTDSIMNQSYPWIIMSDEYGSIFSSREWIITKLQVNLWDKVSKWQVVAVVWIASNAPEIIALLASKKADIAVSQWQINAAYNVANYLKIQWWSTGGVMQNVFDQKKKAIDISIDTQKQQLQVRIDNLKTQMGAKKQTIEANKLSSSSVIGLNIQKQANIEKELQWSIQNAIAVMGKVFAKGEITYLSFDREFNLNIYWGAKNIRQRQVFLELMTQVLYQYPKWDTLTTVERFTLADLTEKTLKEWINLLWASIAYSEYTIDEISSDIASLINASSDKDTGITTILSSYKELQQEFIGSNAIASWGIIQSNADLAGIDQEIALLSKQIDLLDAEKQKELAELNGDQSIRWFDIQKLIIESEANVLKAKAELQANQNALWAIQSISKSVSVTAPFAGTISRKNIVIGQSIQANTPIFDIVGNSSNSKPFVRFEVPVREYWKLKAGQILQIWLGWDQPLSAWSVSRIAQSVNQDTQTLTVEGTFDGESPYPLGTNIRVSSQGLSGTTVVEIPNTAIKQDEQGKSFVYKLLPTNILKQWYITIAYTDWSKSYVNEGLKTTDAIVANIFDGDRKDGMTVNIVGK